MEQNMTLPIAFNGSAKINGQPLFVKDGIYTMGGYIDTTNTEVAYFGRAVSTVPGTDKNSFVMGFPGSSNFAGVLINEQAVRENDPAKADYILPGLPATALIFGQFWLPSWTKTAAGSIDPVVGAKVIALNSTGAIEFLGSGTAVPGTATQLNATVIFVDDYLGALVFLGHNSVTLGITLSSVKRMELFALPLSPYLATITEGTKAIAITVPNGSVVTALKAQFVVPEDATVKIGATAQVSGTTANDFTNPVVYRVTAADGSYVDYTVTVTVAP